MTMLIFIVSQIMIIGVICPAMVSSESDLLVFAGIALAIISLKIFYNAASKTIKKQLNKEK
jgi:hypothetical protein